jgi:predicted nucleic acid-binding protein
VIYFDSAYIAKCYLNEPGAERVRAVARTADGLVSCEIARIEVFATLHRHLREGHLAPADLRRVIATFESDEQDGVWDWIPMTGALIKRVCDRLKSLPTSVFIRAVDALHLECARAEGFSEVYTNDRHMAAAAMHFKIDVTNVLV